MNEDWTPLKVQSIDCTLLKVTTYSNTKVWFYKRLMPNGRKPRRKCKHIRGIIRKRRAQ